MNTTHGVVPVIVPRLGQREIQYVTEALQAGEISGNCGKFISRFEREFADYCTCSHAVASSNGTTALHLALASLGIGPGDEVLVSTLTFMSTFFAVLYQGATPIPVDSESDTCNLNPALLEQLITPRTKAILVVHIFGHPADMDPILDIARKRGLYVIEDAAEAHGALYKGRKVGSMGDVGCFSFYANKIVNTGEGGMLTINDPAIAERARSLRSLAYGRKQKFMHSGIGFNYRMSNLQAAIGCAQLEKIDETIEGKRRMSRLYGQYLGGTDGICLPIEKPYARSVFWMYHVVLKDQFSNHRDDVVENLAEAGIETRPCFIPYNLQEAFIRTGMTHPDLCPVANQLSKNGLYLPSSPDLTEDQIKHISHQLKTALKLSTN